MGDIKVRTGRRINDFGDGSRFKSDLALSTSLSTEKINEVVKKTMDKLSAREQPIRPHDIATTTHFVMAEMNLRNEGAKYMELIQNRFDGQTVGKVKVPYIYCQYCGVNNPIANEKCSGCGATLDRKKAGAKII
jgi:ribosomal protein L40E